MKLLLKKKQDYSRKYLKKLCISLEFCWKKLKSPKVLTATN